jgi:hypothetical protein
MNKLSLLLILLITCQLSAQDNSGYVMYSTILLTPKSGHGKQLNDGLKAHNKKYHTEGASRVDVWSIETGPRSGSLEWVEGPMTWTDNDTKLSDAHTADWTANVVPHADMGEVEYWKLAEGMTYAPEGQSAKVMQIRWFEINENKANNARELFGTLIKAYKDLNFDMGLHVFTNQANAGDGRDWAILWMHNNWASLDKDRGFTDKYDEMYGKNAWNEFWENWNEAVNFKGTEIHSLVPELSASGSN